MCAEWDVIVVGAGIVGSWTAYHLTQRGQRTLLLDQVRAALKHMTWLLMSRTQDPKVGCVIPGIH